MSFSENPSEDRYAWAYIDYSKIAQAQKDTNWQDYAREAGLCYNMLSPEVQNKVNALLAKE